MNILVAYDGSDVAKDALQLAQKRAKIWQAEINVVRHLDQSREIGYEEIHKAEDQLHKEVRAFLKDENDSFRTHLLVSSLTAGEEIVEFAARIHADEIVVGVRRRSRVGKLFFGSTAQYIVLNAPCPVVTIK
ncbi:MAG: universal stress protein [Desulfobacterales bacterium]|nr:MAG: universal stress protein [Desulfobacterales bacterium]